MRSIPFSALAFALLALALSGASALAQDIEPRAYSNAPVGVNFFVAGYAFTDGGLSMDPSLPLTDPELETHNLVLAYARVLDLWGKSAKFDAVVPYCWLSGSALYLGKPIERVVDGLSDSKFRLSVNLYGAPAVDLKEFAGYKQDVIVGVSLQVSAPVGQYDESRLVNIGANRWTFKPEIGVSKAVGRWTFETAVAATFFTTNHSFFNGHERAQDPILSAQGHVIYSFKRGMWGSLDATYFTGGETTLDGTVKDDMQKNWRIGGTFAIPVNPRNSVKLYISDGVSARTGNNYFLAGFAWQVRWGGGL